MRGSKLERSGGRAEKEGTEEGCFEIFLNETIKRKGENLIHIMTKKWCQEPILVPYLKRSRPALAASIEYMTWTTTKINTGMSRFNRGR